MKPTKEKIDGIVLEYDSGIIPPPYSHVFRLSLDWGAGSLKAKLDLHYTDREELSEEEILDEGFTVNDDYSYQGSLNNIWIDPILELFQKTKWSNNMLEEGGIMVGTKTGKSSSELKAPSNQEEWQLMAQDLIQAIYETTKKEAPLQVKYRRITHEDSVDCSLTVHFSNREVSFVQGDKTRKINWEFAIQLMKLVFTPDYHYELAKEEPGKKRGAYIDCGDGYWHELGKGVVNIDPSFDAVSRIRSTFDELID
ncbi:hypothetical protein [Algoriphagus sp. CAU 1675]|uniref:hypothetical protein n=1 Tax=Algoriphagus sp. CAU 1675 TaxID=3032597 RepID=UPI0023DB6D1E|nr:hypothetical protein [Algoriphagus sp. CAU 1675]MDF2158301.1 hypothetical protein [Algoriphagus sp. CAU 1675]